MPDFKVRQQKYEDIVALHLSGNLDAHTVDNFEQVIKSCIEKEQFKILVNMEDLDYISSAGLGVFMGYINIIRENGGDIKLSNLKGNVKKVFELIGFHKIYDIYPSEQEAINIFLENKSLK